MRKRIISLFAGITVASTVLAGCGGSGASSAKSNYAESAYDYDAAYDTYPEEAYLSDDLYEYEEEQTYNSGSEGISDENIQSATNRKLIKTVNMSVETKEFDKLLSNVEKKINQLGGYAESTNISGNSYEKSGSRYANITARIPAENLDAFVNSVENESNITSKNESAEDVTLSYADIEAHNASLRIEQERLNELLKEADSLETIIILQQRLTEVRYEIESYESRLRAMDNQVTYSTVYLNVSEVKEYKPEPVEELTFGQRLSIEFEENCAAAWETIQSFVISLISFIPILLVLILILGVIGLIIFAIVKLVIVIVKKIIKKRPVSAKKVNASGKVNVVRTAVALDEKPDFAADNKADVREEELIQTTDIKTNETDILNAEELEANNAKSEPEASTNMPVKDDTTENA